VLKKRLLFSILLFWVILITVLSLVSFRKIPKITIENSDKYVHFTFYFVFTFLLYVNFFQKWKTIKSILYSVLIAIIYGIIIEGLQELLTQTRKAEINDVFFNILGTLTGAFLTLTGRKRLIFLK
jgi:VanZ family protein